jgi:hypothetical protein
MFRRPLVVAYLSLFLGGGALSAFLLFLFVGSFNLVDLGLDRTSLLWFDAALAALFFVQHSVMVRRPFRKRFCAYLPPEYVNAFYSMASGITLGVVMVLWQRSGDLVLIVDGVWRWLLRFVFFGSAAGFYWGTRALGVFDPFGTSPILRRLRGREPVSIPFVAKGPYRWVRHPLYLCMILMIWSCPDLSVDRLLFNLLWSGWIWIGCRLEERDLLLEFGQAYQNYQAQVPMLIPRVTPLHRR